MKNKGYYVRKFMDDTQAQAGMSGVLHLLIPIAITLLIIAVIFQVAPMIGSQVEQSVSVPADSEWNHTKNDDIPQGTDIWEKTSMFTIVVVVVVLGLVIAVLTGLIRVGSI